jgi:hypothetical protein
MDTMPFSAHQDAKAAVAKPWSLLRQFAAPLAHECVLLSPTALAIATWL